MRACFNHVTLVSATMDTVGIVTCCVNESGKVGYTLKIVFKNEERKFPEIRKMIGKDCSINLDIRADQKGIVLVGDYIYCNEEEVAEENADA
jgi:hypothetical protein